MSAGGERLDRLVGLQLGLCARKTGINEAIAKSLRVDMLTKIDSPIWSVTQPRRDLSDGSLWA